MSAESEKNDIFLTREIAEKELLGGLLLKPEAIEMVSEELQPEMFTNSDYKIIYQAMLELHANTDAIDLVLLIEQLKKNWNYDEVSVKKIIFPIVEDIPNAINLMKNVDLIAGKYEIGKEEKYLERFGFKYSRQQKKTYFKDLIKDAKIIEYPGNSIVFHINAKTKIEVFYPDYQWFTSPGDWKNFSEYEKALDKFSSNYQKESWRHLYGKHFIYIPEFYKRVRPDELDELDELLKRKFSIEHSNIDILKHYCHRTFYKDEDGTIYFKTIEDYNEFNKIEDKNMEA